MSMNRIKRSLPVRLTDEEKLHVAGETAKAAQDHQDAIDRKSEVTKQLAAEVEQHRTAIHRHGTLLANGYE